MQTNKTIGKRIAVWLAVLAALLMLVGCNEQYLQWSPDGEKAAIVAPDGLRLCDASGKLTEPLVEQVERAVWLHDSRHLVLVRDSELPDWKACAATLGMERAAALEADAAALLAEVKQGKEWKKAGNFSEARRQLAQVYLCREKGAEVRDLIPPAQWSEQAAARFHLKVMVVVEWDGRQMLERRQLRVTVHAPEGLRVSPDGSWLAYAQEEDFGPDDGGSLWLLPLAGGAAPQRIAAHVNRFPDWSPDGKWLVYLQTSIGGEGKGGLQVGTLSRRRVRADDGRIALGEKAEDLAGLIVNPAYRVRCLRDGRILFNAAEFTLPMAEKDFGEEKEQLVCLDLARQATLVRVVPKRQAAQLPQNLSQFEVSPDERQVVMGGTEGEVVVLTLGSGDVEIVQTAGAPKVRQIPGWRRAGEPWFVRREPAGAGAGERAGRRGEVVVQKDGQITVLSRDWPDAVRDRLVEPENK